ncbi:MAG TPA: type ISP restriction/modification enzyme, partial [Thermoanaerobaculia bacterium]|nr:type ISP restriction/modification enzyme [Thermoanaerobaculia bacterium]
LAKRVLRADLFGSRREKLAALAASHTGNTAWTAVEPDAPSFFFLSYDREVEREYRRGLSLPEIFPRFSTGVITGCDALAIHFDRRALEERLSALRRAPAPDRRIDSRAWERLRSDPEWRQRIRGYLVHPFDSRFLFYADYFLERPRTAVLAPLAARGEHLALVACRQTRGEVGALVTRGLAGHKAVSTYDSSSVFPLYRAPERKDAGGDPALLAPVPNLAPDLLPSLAERYGTAPQAEEILAYVYALLYDPGYRARYRNPLRLDFARVRFPRDLALFRQLAALGRELIGLHLLTDERLLRPSVRLVGADSESPARRRLGAGTRTLFGYDPSRHWLHLNAIGLRFEGVAPEVLEYEIGGCRVLPGWLRARAGRGLTVEDSTHFCRVAAALSLTLEVQARIAEVGTAAQDF